MKTIGLAVSGWVLLSAFLTMWFRLIMEEWNPRLALAAAGLGTSVALGIWSNLARAALEAPDAFRPPGSGHVVQALLLGAERFLNIYQA